MSVLANALHYAADHLPVIAEFVFNNPLSVNKPVSASAIKIFPNPATTQFSITKTSKESATLEIFDVFGKSVHKQSIEGFNATIKISFLAKGAYIVRVVQNSISHEHLLLKQ